ncbi:MAG TPA: phenylalanine--tRNA ligase subunit beta [Holophaga sp.]|nr:phenylalanine--tRNA ligase subunit beta [Holophaga sp.]
MRIEIKALECELPALGGRGTVDLCELLAGLGFPVDAVEQVNGETVLEVDVTANRGDVMSHRGLARDVAAKLSAELSPLAVPALDEGEALLSVRLEDPACPLYATAILELGDQATPAAAQAFLASMGTNAKNLAPVDASNELLHRYGHPTHAFDADKLRGGIVVRRARAGEKLVTLDGVERTLNVEDLCIADDSGVIALAGVMGGDSTKVDAGTRRVLLESAYFEPRVVRAMARRHGLHSDASHRFGRGTNPAFARTGRDLLAQRLMAWAGARLKGVWTAGSERPTAAAIVLQVATLQRIAGEPLEMAEAAALLGRLGCRVELTGDVLKAVPPSWRHDLAIPEDLAEEVLRLRGYDRIPSVLPSLEGYPEPLSDAFIQGQDVSRRLASLGFHQTVTLGFVRPEADAAFAAPDNPAEGRTLVNPLGVEYSVMRASLLASLKSAAELNQRQGAKEVRLFEIAPTYTSTPNGPIETRTLGLVWGGTLGGEDFLTKARPVQVADMLGVLRELGADQVQVREWPGGFLAAEVAMDALPKPSHRVIPTFKPFSRFPTVERDLSLLVDLDQSYRALASEMEARVRAAAGSTFQDVRCVDVFRHKSLPEGRQGWLFRLRFQAMDRTLTSEEVDGWTACALEAARSLGAELRA